MSLLTIVQAVADEVGVNQPSTVVGSEDVTAVQLLAIAKSSLERMSSEHKWTVLQQRFSFVAYASASVSSYALPADFDRFVNETWWDETNRRYVFLGDPQQWQILTRGNLGAAGIDVWLRQLNDRLAIWPVRTSGSQVLAYDYQTTNLAKSSAGTAKTTFTADNDEPRIKEKLLKLDLIWRFKRAKGLAYADEKVEFERMWHSETGADGGAPDLSMNGQRLTNVLAVNIQDANFPSA